jgi:hypothetical protein
MDPYIHNAPVGIMDLGVGIMDLGVHMDWNALSALTFRTVTSKFVALRLRTASQVAYCRGTGSPYV